MLVLVNSFVLRSLHMEILHCRQLKYIFIRLLFVLGSWIMVGSTLLYEWKFWCNILLLLVLLDKRDWLLFNELLTWLCVIPSSVNTNLVIFVSNHLDASDLTLAVTNSSYMFRIALLLRHVHDLGLQGLARCVRTVQQRLSDWSWLAYSRLPNRWGRHYVVRKAHLFRTAGLFPEVI